MKFFPIALRAALREVQALRNARGLEVTLLDGSRARIVDLDPWVLMNLKIDEVLLLTRAIEDRAGSTPISRERPWTLTSCRVWG